MTSQNHSLTTLGGSGDHAPDDGMQSGRSRLFDGRATMNSFSATVTLEAASSDKFSKEGGCRKAPLDADIKEIGPVDKKLMLDGASGGAHSTSGQGIQGQHKKGGNKNSKSEKSIF